MVVQELGSNVCQHRRRAQPHILVRSNRDCDRDRQDGDQRLSAKTVARLKAGGATSMPNTTPDRRVKWLFPERHVLLHDALDRE